jgi:hypothetical protein
VSRLAFNARLVFFDRNVIRTNWAAINRNPTQRAGLLVRRIALNLIGRSGVPYRTPPRPAGQAPRSRQRPRGQYVNARGRLVNRPTPFKMIYALPTNMGTGSIIGMVGFDSQAVPGRHELGLSGRVRRGQYRDPMHRRIAMRLRRAGNLRGLARFQQRNMTMTNRTAHYPQRPFMRPALQRAAPRIPAFWANSLTRASR